MLSSTLPTLMTLDPITVLFYVLTIWHTCSMPITTTLSICICSSAYCTYAIATTSIHSTSLSVYCSYAHHHYHYYCYCYYCCDHVYVIVP